MSSPYLLHVFFSAFLEAKNCHISNDYENNFTLGKILCIIIAIQKLSCLNKRFTFVNIISQSAMSKYGGGGLLPRGQYPDYLLLKNPYYNFMIVFFFSK